METAQKVSDLRLPFLTATWRNLVVVNYQIDPDILRPYVPKGTVLDDYNGQTLVSAVGFHFAKTRFLGFLPIWPFSTFEEVNLRFYIRREVGDEIRRAVCFVKELVPYRLIAAVARTVYHENYEAMPMTHQYHWVDENHAELGASFEYRWLHENEWGRVWAETEGALLTLEPGSLEEFVLEHYWGYSAGSGARTIEYRVEHTPWRYWQVSQAQFEANIDRLYGPAFACLQNAPIHSAFVARGSPISVLQGRVIT